MGLFTPAWKGNNELKALKSVGKIKNEKKLCEIALTAPLKSTRLAAVEKIRDEQILGRIASSISYGGAGLADVKDLLLDSPVVISDIKSDQVSVCLAAVKKLLPDSPVLISVAKSTGYISILEIIIQTANNEEACSIAFQNFIIKDRFDKYNSDMVNFIIAISKDKPELIKKNWNLLITNFKGSLPTHDDERRLVSSSSDCTEPSWIHTDRGLKSNEIENIVREFQDRFPPYVKP
jgi:hypothetical protein